MLFDENIVCKSEKIMKNQCHELLEIGYENNVFHFFNDGKKLPGVQCLDLALVEFWLQNQSFDVYYF